MYFKQIQEFIIEEVAIFIRENGAKHDPSRLAKVAFLRSFLFIYWSFLISHLYFYLFFSFTAAQL